MNLKIKCDSVRSNRLWWYLLLIVLLEKTQQMLEVASDLLKVVGTCREHDGCDRQLLWNCGKMLLAL